MYFAAGAAHDAGKRDRLLAIRYHDRVLWQPPILAVKGCHGLARRGTPDNNPALRQAI